VHTTVRGASLAKYSATGATPHLLDKNLDLDVKAGSLAQLSDVTAAISSDAADRADVGIGDTLRLRLGDGTPAALRVVAIYARGLGFGDLILAHDFVASHIDDPLDDSVLIKANPSASKQPPTALASHLRRYVEVHVVDRTSLGATQPSQRELNNRIQYLFLGLIIAFAAIAAVNALAVAVIDRADELALLRLIGATRRQVSRIVQLETVLTVAIALIVGSAVAAATVSSFSAGVTPGRPHIPWLVYLELIAATTLLTLLVSRLATTAALRMQPSKVMSGSTR
jgi:putative ABC transport system permease protein